MSSETQAADAAQQAEPSRTLGVAFDLERRLLLQRVMRPRRHGVVAGLVFVLATVALLSLFRSLLSHRPLTGAPSVQLSPRQGWDSEPLLPREVPALDAATRLATQAAATPPLTETDNILLAGLDTRPRQLRGRTDALLLTVLDRRGGHAGLVSVPRDLLVDVDVIEPRAVDAGQTPHAGQSPGAAVRINTVFQRAGGGERGAAALARAVRRVLGLPVHHVVIVDHVGFEALVDAIGGVSVLVRCPLVERFVDPRAPAGHRTLRLASGPQRMDGATALMFVRARHGRGIYDRARRQQALLEALRLRLLVIGLRRGRELLPALRQAVYSDMTTLELLRLARRVLRLDRRRVHGLVLDSRHATPAMLGGRRWVLIPDPPKIRAALTELFSTAAPGERRWRGCPRADAGFRQRNKRSPRSAQGR